MESKSDSQFYFCVSQAGPPKPIDAKDARPDSVWRQGWASAKKEPPIIVKVRVEELKDIEGNIVMGPPSYRIDIDDASNENDVWRGGHFESPSLPFIFSVFRLKSGFIGKQYDEAKSYVNGVLAAGGTAELCYNIRVYKAYEKIHVDVAM